MRISASSSLVLDQIATTAPAADAAPAPDRAAPDRAAPDGAVRSLPVTARAAIDAMDMGLRGGPDPDRYDLSRTDIRVED